MSNITKYGFALPQYSIENKTLHPQGKKGKHTVCYTDEDIITLAYAAAAGIDGGVDGVFFATTTPVFKGRYHASYLADLLGLAHDILALDFGTTTRAGTDAFLLADRLVESGLHKNILVIAADVYFPPIGNEVQTGFGHAAVAVVISSNEGIAKINHTKSHSTALAETFIYKGEKITYDARFARTIGYKNNTNLILKEENIKAEDVDKLILNSPYAKLALGSLKKAGFDVDKQIGQDVIAANIGFTGASHGLFQIVNALESNLGKTVLLDYDNGTNLISFTTMSSGDGLKDLLESRSEISSYQDYLALRKQGNFESKGYQAIDLFSSEMMSHREKENLLYLQGFECDDCKTIYYMESARCNNCHGTKFTKKQLDQTGTVYSLTSEFYFPSSFPPTNMMVINLDGGGRITVQQTDDMYQNENNKLQIGDRVQLVLRKMMENDKKPNYFWKCRKLG